MDLLFALLSFEQLSFLVVVAGGLTRQKKIPKKDAMNGGERMDSTRELNRRARQEGSTEGVSKRTEQNGSKEGSNRRFEQLADPAEGKASICLLYTSPSPRD